MSYLNSLRSSLSSARSELKRYEKRKSQLAIILHNISVFDSDRIDSINPPLDKVVNETMVGVKRCVNITNQNNEVWTMREKAYDSDVSEANSNMRQEETRVCGEITRLEEEIRSLERQIAEEEAAERRRAEEAAAAERRRAEEAARGGCR